VANSEQFKKNAEEAAQQAKEKAGKLAHDNREKIAGVLGKLTSAIDKKTQGKYHDKLAKAQDAALKGTDKLAEQRPDSHPDNPVEGTPGGDVPPADPPQGPPPPSGV
jgi:hypothetical protein